MVQKSNVVGKEKDSNQGDCFQIHIRLKQKEIIFMVAAGCLKKEYGKRISIEEENAYDWKCIVVDKDDE